MVSDTPKNSLDQRPIIHTNSIADAGESAICQTSGCTLLMIEERVNFSPIRENCLFLNELTGGNISFILKRLESV